MVGVFSINFTKIISDAPQYYFILTKLLHACLLYVLNVQFVRKSTPLYGLYARIVHCTIKKSPKPKLSFSTITFILSYRTSLEAVQPLALYLPCVSKLQYDWSTSENVKNWRRRKAQILRPMMQENLHQKK